MTKILFDKDPITGEITWFNGDGQGNFTLSHEADIEHIIEDNKRAYNSGTNGWTSPAREMKHVAEIPNMVAMKWLVELGIDINKRDHWPAVKRLLNSNEYRFLRTSAGRI